MAVRPGGGSGILVGGGASDHGIDDFDVSVFVADVIRMYEGETHMTVSPDARNQLLQPAIQHRNHIRHEVLSGKVSPFQIEDAVVTVLRNAETSARKAATTLITGSHVFFSKWFECKYFPWC
jgi:hypothetical protein